MTSAPPDKVTVVLAPSDENLRPWTLAIRRVCRNRRNPFYMPGLLVVVLDMLDAASATPERVPFNEELKARFDGLMKSLGQAKPEVRMPFNYLASQSSIWQLRKGDLLVPPMDPPPRNFHEVVDSAALLPELRPALRTVAGREAVRDRLYSVLDASSQGETLLRAVDAELGTVRTQQTFLLENLDTPFLADVARERAETQTRRYVRLRAFAREVLAQYDFTCALCESSIRYAGLSEVEAAHIWSVAEGGPDDLRNGLALCRTHHWCLDNYLWTVNEGGVVRVQKARAEDRMGELTRFEGRSLRAPRDPRAGSHAAAWEKHHHAWTQYSTG